MCVDVLVWWMQDVTIPRYMNYGSGRRAIEIINTEFLEISQAKCDLRALGTGTELLCPKAPGALSWFNPGQLLLRGYCSVSSTRFCPMGVLESTKALLRDEF